MSPADGTAIQVLRGNPDPEQLAAVTVVLLAILRGTEPPEPPTPPPAGWSPTPHRLPGAWATP
ncbi:acyl-CoA carboxylase subunit epsilon [Streptomyces sp. NPDC047028]|uniref:acyl-CoA carboxylase subunit epsilon n=1 Tax=Streptomyces sp. NPDC047028 TaxID=3155793 RepID=UPI0033E8A275